MRFVCVWLFVIVTTSAIAQKRQKIYYRKNDGSYLPAKDGCDYIQVIQETNPKSGLYDVFEFYPDSSKKFIGHSSKIVPIHLEGQGMSYFRNGNKKLYGTYKDNRLVGVVYEFYPNGKPYLVKNYVTAGDEKAECLLVTCLDQSGKALVADGNGYFKGFDDSFKYIEESGKITAGKKDSVWSGIDKRLKLTFTEKYNDGKLVSGISVDSAGNSHEYKERMVLPKFKDGPDAFTRYLQNKLIYPIQASDSNLQGVVILAFVVPKTGGLEDIRVLHGVGYMMNEEAMRVLNASGRYWLPGTAYGVPIRVAHTLPISFELH